MTTCACGQPATFHELVRSADGFGSLAMCRACWTLEHPERAAVYELAKRTPMGGEFAEAKQRDK